jgi:hypothetical protein
MIVYDVDVRIVQADPIRPECSCAIPVIDIQEFVAGAPIRAGERVELRMPDPGASLSTLQRRATYGGRKGRRAARRIREDVRAYPAAPPAVSRNWR